MFISLVPCNDQKSPPSIARSSHNTSFPGSHVCVLWLYDSWVYPRHFCVNKISYLSIYLSICGCRVWLSTSSLRCVPRKSISGVSYTPWRNLKYCTFLFVDIVKLCTISILSSNQNEANICCRLKRETLTWPTLHKLTQIVPSLETTSLVPLPEWFWCIWVHQSAVWSQRHWGNEHSLAFDSPGRRLANGSRPLHSKQCEAPMS